MANNLIQRLLKWIKAAVYAWVRVVGTLVSVVLLICFCLSMKSKVRSLPQNSILRLELGGVLQEKEEATLLESLYSGSPNALYDLCHLIKEAAKEPHIQGLFVKLTPLSVSFAQIQELQDALQVFKSSGKKLYLYASDFSSTKEYYLAAMFDEISVLPLGQVGIAGFRLETYFVKGLLDKWGVNPNMYRQGKYKSFAETFTEKDSSAAVKESSLSMLSSMEGHVMKEIQSWRDTSNIQALFEEGNLSLEDALSAKLLTRIGHLHTFEKEILAQYEKDAKFFSAKEYGRILAHKADAPGTGKKYVSILTLSGEIHDDRGTRGDNPFGGETSIRPSKVSKQLKGLMKDKDVAAVILRIDSPGGSANASEEIWAQVKEFSKTKPIIASMSSVAASGGYYIASACSKIVAHPLTLTGSIGVVGGKFNTSQFWENLGVHWGETYTMESALLHSTNHDYSPLHKEKVEKYMKHIYAIFKQRVAEGRNLTLDQVEIVAQGRVWTGLQAKERNLVDELGGISQAFELAKKELKLTTDEHMGLYPHKYNQGMQSLFMSLLGFEEDDAEDEMSLFLYLKNIYVSCQCVFSKTPQLNVEG